MRPVWIAACTLAVIGAFFTVLEAAWMLKLTPQWLPYPCTGTRRNARGLAVSRAASETTLAAFAAFVAGVAAVASLALVSYAFPYAFTLTAARSPNAPILVPVLAIVSGIACALGARLPADASRVWLPTASAFIAACAIQLGGRLAYVAGLPVQPSGLVSFGMAAALGSGVIVRALVRRDCTRDVAAACSHGCCGRSFWTSCCIRLPSSRFGASSSSWVRRSRARSARASAQLAR
jgi:hypothetical protein